MSLQMRFLATFSKRARNTAWGSAATVRSLMAEPPEKRGSDPIPHEFFQVNHVVTDTVATDHGEFTVHSLVPATDAPRDTPLDICLYVHGGGYVRGLSAQHWKLISDIAGAGMKVVVPDYGLAPEFEASAAAGLLDVIHDRAADEADASGHRVSLAGDSAGAGLALGWLLDRNRRGLRTIVDRAALVSPWLDATCSTPGTDRYTPGDPWLHPDGLRVAGASWGRDVGVRSPLVSPLAASDEQLASLPPLRVWSGTRDVLHADAAALAQRTGCGLTVAAGALHNYPLLPAPEGRAGRSDAIQWLTLPGSRM